MGIRLAVSGKQKPSQVPVLGMWVASTQILRMAVNELL